MKKGFSNSTKYIALVAAFLALACLASQLNATTYRDAHNYFPHLPKNTTRLCQYMSKEYAQEDAKKLFPKDPIWLKSYKNAKDILFNALNKLYRTKQRKNKTLQKYAFLKHLDKNARKIVRDILAQDQNAQDLMIFHNLVCANALINGLFKHLDKNKGVFNLTVKEITDLKDRLELAANNIKNDTFNLEDEKLNDAFKSFTDYLNPLIQVFLPNELLTAYSENRTSDALSEEYLKYFGKINPPIYCEGK